MKIVDTTDSIGKWYSNISGEDYREYETKLSPDEIAILKQAYAICQKAEELQTKRNELMGIDDECYNNDYGWVTIYVRNILQEHNASL